MWPPLVGPPLGPHPSVPVIDLHAASTREAVDTCLPPQTNVLVPHGSSYVLTGEAGADSVPPAVPAVGPAGSPVPDDLVIPPTAGVLPKMPSPFGS